MSTPPTCHPWDPILTHTSPTREKGGRGEIQGEEVKCLGLFQKGEISSKKLMGHEQFAKGGGCGSIISVTYENFS